MSELLQKTTNLCLNTSHFSCESQDPHAARLVFERPNSPSKPDLKTETAITEHACVSWRLLVDRLEPKSLCLKSSINRNLMDYGKASGMVLAQKYYPSLFPFYDLVIVRTTKEWNEVKDSYGQQMVSRIDYPLGMSHKNAITGTTGRASSIPELMEALRKQGSGGAVMLCKCRDTIIPRYQNASGFNISFSVGNQVIIELVGSGFDGSDLTRGAALHERFVLPWSAVQNLITTGNLITRRNLEQASTEYFCIDQDTSNEYLRSVYRRCRLLIDECHYDAEKVHDSVPQQHYLGLSDQILQVICDKIIKPTVARSATFWHARLTEFSVQGNVPYRIYNGYSIEVWELFRPQRWATSNQKYSFAHL